MPAIYETPREALARRQPEGRNFANIADSLRPFSGQIIQSGIPMKVFANIIIAGSIAYQRYHALSDSLKQSVIEWRANPMIQTFCEAAEREGSNAVIDHHQSVYLTHALGFLDRVADALQERPLEGRRGPVLIDELAQFQTPDALLAAAGLSGAKNNVLHAAFLLDLLNPTQQ